MATFVIITHPVTILVTDFTNTLNDTTATKTRVSCPAKEGRDSAAACTFLNRTYKVAKKMYSTRSAYIKKEKKHYKFYGTKVLLPQFDLKP